MPTRYDSDSDSDDLRRNSGAEDREISLGTGTVLGIFLALALLCSLFFGLGYSMGRKSVSAAVLASAPLPVTSPSGIDKPSPEGPEARTSSRTPRSDLQVTQPMEGSTSGTSTERPARSGSEPRSTQTKFAAPGAAPAAAAQTSGETGAQSFVQVAAVSRKEDADLLLSALRRRGYVGLVRQAPQDKLLHIQVGPFATKKEAEAMRQRLITDGYNPIIK